jgi:hypothetical protein
MTEVNYVGRPDTALSPNVCDEIGENWFILSVKT